MLQAVDLKLQRAFKRTQDLIKSINQWSVGNPVKCRCELKDKRLGFLLILDDFENPQALQDWGLETGEIIHNLRSCLDNLVFLLAELKAKPPQNPRSLKFPIYANADDFARQTKKVQDQLHEPVFNMIELLQPFQRSKPDIEGTPEIDPLIRLNWLSNQDKHQIPLSVNISPNQISHSAGVQYYSEQDAEKNVPPKVTIWGDKLATGVTLMDYHSDHPIKKVEGNFQFQCTINIETNNDILPFNEMLIHLVEYTALVVNQFRGFTNNAG